MAGIREMGGKGRWVAKRIWVAKLVSRLLATAGSSLGSNQDILKKYKMGDISKGVAKTLSPARKLFKKKKNNV